MSEPTPPWEQSNDLWFEDGNIILVGERVGYRVYRSMLCAHSDAFNDMFGVVDPTAGEAFDGCPVIELLDSSEDVYNMLRAIHFRQFGRVESKPPFSLIASLLCMSTKYMIDGLRAEMISILSTIFPVTLEAYEASSHAYHPRNIDPIMAVHLGLSYNVPSIIPLACYLVCLMDARDFVTAQIDAPLLPSWKACVLFRESFMAGMEICVRESCQAVACSFPTAQPSVA